MIRQRTGSLAVFFCILLASVVLVGNSWLQAARVRAAEVSLSQAMAAQINVTLASYEQDLHDQFGLFAFSERAFDRQVFYGSLPPAMQACPLWLSGGQALSETAVLDAQMVRQMKARLPGAWLDLFITRWSDLSSFVSALKPAAGLEPDLAFQPAAGFAAVSLGLALHEPADSASGRDRGAVPLSSEPALFGSLSDLFRNTFRSLSGTLVRRTAEYLFSQLMDELLEELEADLIGGMRDTFDRFSVSGSGAGADLIGELLGGLPDFFNPQSLTGMASAMEQVLDFSTYPVYEKLCVVEYILSYLTQRPAGRYADGVWQPARTPDGRLIKDLQAARPAEIEQVVSGLQDPEQAAGTCRFILVSLRSLLHVAALLTNEQRMAVLRGTAATIVTAVAAASLGTVVLEPEAVTYLLVAAEALSAGIRDSSRLAEGHGVRFWPGKGAVDFALWYDDYLRLMLYSLPRAVLVDRTGQLLQRLFREPLFTEVRVETRFAGRSFCLRGGYG